MAPWSLGVAKLPEPFPFLEFNTQGSGFGKVCERSVWWILPTGEAVGNIAQEITVAKWEGHEVKSKLNF